MIIEGKYAASSVLLRQGIRLDLESKKYRLIQKALGFIELSNPWKALPKLDYILLFKTFYAKCEPCDLNEAESSTVQLSLVYNKNRKLIIDEGRNFPTMMKTAKDLSAALGLRIKDAATDRRNPVWLKT